MGHERGQSVSAFVAVVVFALLLMAGLVVDGGRQSAAARRAQAVAAGAARAAVDYTATARLAGRVPDAAGTVRAAQDHLAAAGELSGTITLPAPGVVRAETHVTTETVFLSLIGINRLAATGLAEAQLVRS